MQQQQGTCGVASFVGDALTEGIAVEISADGLTSGSALAIESTDNAVLTNGNLLTVDHSGNTNTVVGPMLISTPTQPQLLLTHVF